MKRKMFLLAAITISALSSCKDEEKDKVVNEPKQKTKSEMLMEDSWDVNTMKIETYVNDTLAFSDVETINGKAVFKSDHTMIASVPGEADEIVHWDLKGDTLYLDSMAAYILELSDIKLTLKVQETEEIPDFGKVEINMTTYLTR